MSASVSSSSLHEIRTRLYRLWRLDRWLHVAWAAMWTIIWGILWTAVLAVCDFWMHSNDGGIRWLLFLACLAGWIAAFTIVGLRMWRRQPADVTQWAERCEQLFPQLGTRLSTAAAFVFVDDRDAHLGSTSLRAAFVDQVAQESHDVPLRRALPWSATAYGAAVLLLVAVMLAGAAANGPWVRLAVVRLMQPWQHHPWPQHDRLVVIAAPETVGRGEPFTIRVKNERGPLPRRVRFEMRPVLRNDSDLAGSGAAATYLMGRKGAEAVLRIDSVTSAFDYRVTGGDHQSMPWRRVRVVDYPKWTIVRRAVVPPAYTRLGVRETPASIHAIAGSRVILVGRTERAIQSVVLLTDTCATTRIAFETENRTEWRLPDGAWTIEQSGHYELEFTDPSGFRWTSDRALVEATPDRPPVLSIRKPASGATILPSSSVVILATVSDDIGLEYAGWKVTSGAQLLADRRIMLAGQGRTNGNPPVLETEIDGTWDAGEHVLEPDRVVSISVYARDTNGQSVESPAVAVRVVSQREMLQAVQRIQDRIALQLARAHDLQVAVRTHVQQLSLKTPVETVRNEMESLRLTQRQIDQSILHNRNAAVPLATMLRDMIQQHRLELPELLALSEQFLADAGQNGSQLLEDIDRAWQAVSVGNGDPAPFPQLLRSQEGMEKWLAEWEARWGRQRDLAKLRTDLDDLQKRQRDVHQRTETLRVRLLTDPDSADARSELAKLGSDQDELRLAWEAWRAQADQTVRRAMADGARVLEQIDRLGVSAAMQDAGREARTGRVGRSAEAQRAALQKLATAASMLGRDQSGNASEASSNDGHLSLLVKRLVEWQREQQSVRDVTGRFKQDPPAPDARSALVERQRALRVAVALERDQLELHASVNRILEKIMDKMELSERRLAGGVDERAVVAQDQAIALLHGLAESLIAQPTKKNGPETPASEDSKNAPATRLPPPGVLQLLQAQLLEETREVDARRREQGLNPELAQEIQKLASEQAELANWIAEALRQAAGKNESSVDSVPQNKTKETGDGN